MSPPERLETKRLILRPPVLDDARAIFEGYAQDSEVTRYLVWRPHASINDTQAFLRRCLDVWSTATAFPWVLIQRETNRLIGMIEFRIDGFKADFGFVLARAHWGQGYMTEATQDVVLWALNQDSIWRVWAVCDVENKRSVRVLEKAGMKREGILRRWIVHPNLSEEPRDSYSYAITK